MRRKIHVTGVVQGVGFRPFVYQLATRGNLRGWVANTSAGVEIELEGDDEALGAFAASLVNEKPPLASIHSVTIQDLPSNGHSLYREFEIRPSVAQEGDFQPISPDISICADCLRELFDPTDCRYRYPFINCTNCGPRFTIIRDIPYDRPQTTMGTFELCDDCAREYHDPLNRRFHAQPVACPRCGPKVWLETKDEGGRMKDEGGEAIVQTQRLLSEGKVVAVKGLGGFHLACDATNADAVRTLRERKRRVEKPFALMMRDLAEVERHCYLSDTERELITSRERPIVLLKRRAESSISLEVAPGQATLGVMLPYTPLHYLLLTNDERRRMNDGDASARRISENDSSLGLRADASGGRTTDAPTTCPSSSVFRPPSSVVMTSGNLSEEPIASDNAEARERLAELADAFLMHDREIHTRCDDAVVRAFGQEVYPLRRSRGYAPFPVQLPFDIPPTLAVGAELKNTFCVTRDQYAFLSHHIGDLENYETLRSFEDGVAHFEKLFRIKPRVLAYDLHPDYLATRYALERAEREGLRAVGIQHHHAHIAACMAEHSLSGERPVIGVAFDGTGLGDDDAIWGGEFLIADYAGFQRAAHLAYVPLPGGDKATREPWRIALAWLDRAGIEWGDDLFPVEAASDQARRVLRHQIERRVNAPLTSSMGRLFDAVASLAGVRQRVNYEAQAAIEFEALADAAEQESYEFEIQNYKLQIRNSKFEVDSAPLIRALVADVRAGVSTPIIAARFHNGVALMVRDVCRTLRLQFNVNEVALSGGVWQNMTLLRKTVELLRQASFTVYIHRLVPANDGGIALGQAVIAGRRGTF